ncbi:hypothetical protein TrST_g8298 [Triparma strigata]|uniref:Uncharacterized protein n=1 Tax=Triparma strigata TaxID=1606541 RepID=A0A9W6ZV30_9STRA|nr:hypothetical protein TrST_g8298 [Triparma strigata]
MKLCFLAQSFVGLVLLAQAVLGIRALNDGLLFSTLLAKQPIVVYFLTDNCGTSKQLPDRLEGVEFESGPFLVSERELLKTLGVLITPSMYILTTDSKEIQLFQTNEEQVAEDYSKLIVPSFFERGAQGSELEGRKDLLVDRGHYIMQCCCVDADKCKMQLQNIIISVNPENCEVYPFEPMFFFQNSGKEVQIKKTNIKNYVFLLNKSYIVKNHGGLEVSYNHFECKTEEEALDLWNEFGLPSTIESGSIQPALIYKSFEISKDLWECTIKENCNDDGSIKVYLDDSQCQFCVETRQKAKQMIKDGKWVRIFDGKEAAGAESLPEIWYRKKKRTLEEFEIMYKTE